MHPAGADLVGSDGSAVGCGLRTEPPWGLLGDGLIVLARLCCVRPTSWIDLDATTNTRCVSGYRTRDGREVQPRRLIRSDTLDGLTDRDTAVLRDEHHVRQVIDLRDEEECRYETPNRLHSDGSVTLIRHRMLARAPNRGSEGSSDAARHLSTGRVVTTVLDPTARCAEHTVRTPADGGPGKRHRRAA